MFRFLLVAAFVPILVFGLTNPQQCLNGAPLPFGVQISGCVTAPCDLVIGTVATMEVHFTAKSVHYSLFASIYAESFGMTGIYELPESQADVCRNISPQSCPLDEGEDVTYVMKMPVDPIYPITDMVLEVLISEGSNNITCFRVPARTRN